MMNEPIVTESAEETLSIGRALALRLHAPMLVLLKGDLGAGKTTLTKGIISGLGAAEEEEVTSPTFTLIHVFEKKSDRADGSRAGEEKSGRSEKPLKIYHVDLYRIEGTHDLETLALDDILGEIEPGIVIVEWSERLTFRSEWPVVRIEMDHLGEDKRGIRVTGLAEFGSIPA
jgi:tRNA threonylcarbamoyladenosine biosynthesis protein TsaE